MMDGIAGAGFSGTIHTTAAIGRSESWLGKVVLGEGASGVEAGLELGPAQQAIWQCPWQQAIIGCGQAGTAVNGARGVKISRKQNKMTKNRFTNLMLNFSKNHADGKSHFRHKSLRVWV